ncbi:hypothetical protein DSO57_1008446 [Entomophthora muscae]|uniref:Uncharacterized protein n=1 Tax=Entomophthora muscae TaxID=34485 RepID=A0ACC2T709_9FUNG|nr:hypothetical protein DSO57_1008446 [Entomophthora muscae]
MGNKEANLYVAPNPYGVTLNDSIQETRFVQDPFPDLTQGISNSVNQIGGPALYAFENQEKILFFLSLLLSPGFISFSVKPLPLL